MILYNNFLLKRGVGLFSRVGLFSGDYGKPRQYIMWLRTYKRVDAWLFPKVIGHGFLEGVTSSLLYMAHTHSTHAQDGYSNPKISLDG